MAVGRAERFKERARATARAADAPPHSIANDGNQAPASVVLIEPMRKAAALVMLASLALAPRAEAKLVPRFDRQVARPGERVTVRLGSGAEFFPPPLHVYLVPIRRESAREWHIKTVRAGPYGFIPFTQRFRFRVPAVPPGRYTLAILVRTSAGTWHNIQKGLWRAPNLASYLILRVR
jgi:hypothetical protein